MRDADPEGAEEGKEKEGGIPPERKEEECGGGADPAGVGPGTGLGGAEPFDCRGKSGKRESCDATDATDKCAAYLRGGRRLWAVRGGAFGDPAGGGGGQECGGLSGGAGTERADGLSTEAGGDLHIPRGCGGGVFGEGVPGKGMGDYHGELSICGPRKVDGDGGDRRLCEANCPQAKGGDCGSAGGGAPCVRSDS